MVVASVDGHAFAESRHVLGEVGAGFGFQVVDPVPEGSLGGFVEAMPGFIRQFVGLGERGELGGVENFVGVRVADATAETGVGESSLEGVIFAGEGDAEGFWGGGEDVDAAGVEGAEGSFALDDVEGGSAFGSGFGEGQGPVGEVEGGEVMTSFGGVGSGLPVEASGDHHVEDEVDVVVGSEGDPFTEAADLGDGVVAGGFGRGRDGSEQEGRQDTDGLDGLTEDAGVEGVDPDGDVGELGQFLSIVSPWRIDCIFVGRRPMTWTFGFSMRVACFLRRMPVGTGCCRISRWGMAGRIGG